jgi:hypothetical protein
MADGWLKRKFGPLWSTSPEERFYIIETYWKIAIVAAALFAVYQFLDALEDRRVERSMDYIANFERGPVASARATVNAALRPYAADFAQMAKQGVSAEDKKAIIKTLVEDDETGRLADALDRQVDFYEGLRLCVGEDLCSRNVIAGYFCPERAAVLWNDFRPYIDERRANNPDYARGLQWCAATRRQDP